MSTGPVARGIRGWLARWQGGHTGAKAPDAATSTSAKRTYLSETNIFCDLAAEDMDCVSQITTIITAKKGRTIYSQMEPAEVLFILKKGRVQIYRLTPDGRKLTLATLGPGTIFGEMALIGQHMQSSYAEAIDDITLCVMSQHDLENVLINKPRVALRLLAVLAGRMRELESHLEGIAFKGVPARLADLLLTLDHRSGPMIQGFSHLELAEMIGATRETVTKVLDEFREAGLVEIGRRQVTVLNRDRLQQIAEA